jgi:hypothetical protein
MNAFGLVIGIVTLGIIGLGFPLVIQSEKYLGYLWWPYMLAAGLALTGASTLIQNNALCVLTAVFGATVAWGATELKEQAARAELGWYPHKPRKIQPPFAEIIRQWKAPHL